jgi:hypothetical protein
LFGIANVDILGRQLRYSREPGWPERLITPVMILTPLGLVNDVACVLSSSHLKARWKVVDVYLGFGFGTGRGG